MISFHNTINYLTGLFADYQKGLEKIVLERKKESVRSVPDWSEYSRVARRGN